MVSPTCPDNYQLNKKTCRCNKIKIKKPQKTKAVKRVKTVKTVKAVKPQKTKAAKTLKPQTRKRCPNGTRKNKKTGLCEAIAVKKKKDIIIIPQNKHNILANAFSSIDKRDLNNLLTNLNSGDDDGKDSLISTVRQQLIKQKSFSPAINRMLISLHPGQHKDFFGCGLSLKNITDNKDLSVKIGQKIENGKSVPICVPWQLSRARAFFLDNLKKLNTIDCNNIIAPVQNKSNCWFNTMFMSFFISDKGRKFFRYFRQLMIEGRVASEDGIGKGKIIKPIKLRKAFFLLNACIEASYNVSGDKDNKNALLMDTNNVIKLIYESFPDKWKKNTWFSDVDQAGNPYYYYKNIIEYLGVQSIYCENKFSIHQIIRLFTNTSPSNNHPVIKIEDNDKYNLDKIFQLDARTLQFTRIPDICVISLQDDNSNIDKPLQFTIVTERESVTYVLDSAIIRNTEKEHFCCTVTCNKQEKGYDGASIGRLRSFSWKGLISRDVEWSFTYGGEFDHYSDMKFNFMKGYQMLFYYRV